MPTYTSLYVPLQEVPSAELNRWQRAFLTQRAPGAANTLATDLDTPSGAHVPKEVVFSAGNTALAPPVDGLLDNGMDWRDREVSVDIYFDETFDIRPGEANDDRQARVRGRFSFYSNVGGRFWPVGPGTGVMAVYVDNTNGYLWLRKPTGYAHGTIRGTPQLKERS